MRVDPVRIRLGWIGLGWVELSWIGLDLIGLDWIGSGWFGLDRVGWDTNYLCKCLDLPLAKGQAIFDFIYTVLSI